MLEVNYATSGYKEMIGYAECGEEGLRTRRRVCCRHCVCWGVEEGTRSHLIRQQCVKRAGAGSHGQGRTENTNREAKVTGQEVTGSKVCESGACRELLVVHEEQ